MQEEVVSDHSRRHFVKSSVLAMTGLSVGLTGSGAPRTSGAAAKQLNQAAGSNPVCIFSKHLHWLDIPEMAKASADMGFDGVDLTVRKGGHIEPEQAVDKLPQAVATIRKAGLEVPMIATDLIDPANPSTEALIKTVSKLGIKHYRTGALPYDESLGVAKSLEKYKKQLEALAALNKKYNIHGAYQNHSGTRVGAAVWDLWVLLKDTDPRWMGVQYDPKHATAEGGMSWVHGLDLLKNHIRCMDIKDFHWEKKEDKWRHRMVPLGEGMVDFKQFFSLVKKYGITGPMSIHFEYPLGGAENGKQQLTVAKEEVLAAMKRDLQTLRNLLREANIG